jgi:hypothetical protein
MELICTGADGRSTGGFEQRNRVMLGDKESGKRAN